MAKKARAKRSTTVYQEHGSPMLAQRVPIIVDETMAAGITRARALVECVLDSYHTRMQINDRQLEAGLRLRALWRGAVYSESVTAAWAEAVSGGGSGGTTRGDAIWALRRALLGADLADQRDQDMPLLVITSKGEFAEPVTMPVRLRPAGHIVVAVCGIDEWAGGTRRLMALREGLTGLADYWKLETD
jgi:hypothetical protein